MDKTTILHGEEYPTVAYLDGWSPNGDASQQAKVNALHLPRRSLSGCPVLVGAVTVPFATLRGATQSASWDELSPPFHCGDCRFAASQSAVMPSILDKAFKGEL